MIPTHSSLEKNRKTGKIQPRSFPTPAIQWWFCNLALKGGEEQFDNSSLHPHKVSHVQGSMIPTHSSLEKNKERGEIQPRSLPVPTIQWFHEQHLQWDKERLHNSLFHPHEVPQNHLHKTENFPKGFQPIPDFQLPGKPSKSAEHTPRWEHPNVQPDP